MPMKTSLAGALAIISHEGIVLSPYRDSQGVWTIGVGHTAAAGPPDPATFSGELTLREAMDLFRRDLAGFEARVNRAFTVPLASHEFDAAVSFDFNTGGIDSATWVKLFNQGRREEAVAAIMNWSKPKEIVPRRLSEQRLFSSGLYPGGGRAMLYPATAAGKVEWEKGRRVDLAEAYGRVPAATPRPPAPAPSRPAGAAPATTGRMSRPAVLALVAAAAAAAAALFFGTR